MGDLRSVKRFAAPFGHAATRTAPDALSGIHCGIETGFGTGMRLASGAPPVAAVMYPPASTMRSNDERSTIKSRMIGPCPPRFDNDGVTRRELAHMQLACCRSTFWAMCRPLIINEHVPQMPSRQSWSNTIASSPSSMRRSFKMSIISRDEASSVISSIVCVSNEPLVLGPSWRHTLRVRFFRVLVTCSSVSGSGLPHKRDLQRGGSAPLDRRCFPTLRRGQSCRHREGPRPLRSDIRP